MGERATLKKSTYPMTIFTQKNSRKWELIYNDKTDQWMPEDKCKAWRGRRRNYKGAQKRLKMMDISLKLTVVMVPWTYTYVKIY